MDLNAYFIANHSEHFVASRRASAGTLRYGNGSKAAAMIGAMAAGVRRPAATVERWARGGNGNVVEQSLPRLHSAR